MAPIIRMQIMVVTIMDTDGLSLIRLMTWLSPAFPVGGFAYSGGIERAVHDNIVCDAEDLAVWLEALLTYGSWWNDSILLAESWHAHDNPARLGQVVELASALAGSAERHLEIMAQGQALVAAASAWPHPVLALLNENAPYAVAVGAVAAAHGVELEQTLPAFLHALTSQAVSAAIRLSVLGQRQGVDVIAGLEQTILRASAAAAQSTLDDLGSATIIADLGAIRHETQHSRLFRS